MLWFLRKYQKGIYIVVTVVVIVSFSFFGTYSTFSEAETVESNRVIGKSIDGNQVMEKEVKSLMRFIEADMLENSISGRMGNLFNDGVIRNDVLKSGLGLQLMKAYKEELEGELTERLAKFRKFRPYVHPNGVFSMEGSWKMFMPKFYQDFQQFNEHSSNLSDESMAALVALYLDQSELSPELMRRFLLYQEKQFGAQVRHDNYLDNGDLSLFYAKSLQDWFGKRFVELVTHFIYNSALYAFENGYQVSLQEARASLMQVGVKNIAKMDQNKQVTPEELTRSFHRQLKALGIHEKDAVGAWQKVLLFRRMYEDVGGSMHLDLATLNEGIESGAEKSIIQVYELPSELKVYNVRDALKIEEYLRSISVENEEGELPKEYLTLERMKNTSPDLITKRFLLEVHSVTKNDVVSEIGLKSTWDWELEDANWNLLVKKFPTLGKCNSTDHELRYAYLQTLDEKIVREIDQYAREQIVQKNPSLIRKSLSKSKAEEKTLYISSSLETDLLPGVLNKKRFLSLLESVPIGQCEENCKIAEALSCFSEDDSHFYSIRVLDRSSDWEIMLLKEALDSKILDKMVDRKLQALHNDTSKKLEDVKLELEEKLYKKYFPSSTTNFQTAFSPIMKVFKEMFSKDAYLVLQPAKEKPTDGKLPPLQSMEEQFKLITKEVTISKGDSSYVDHELPFTLDEGSVSDIISSKHSGPIFFVVKAKKIDEEALAKTISEQRYLLGLDAKKALMKNFLVDMKMKVDFEWFDGS